MSIYATRQSQCWRWTNSLTCVHVNVLNVSHEKNRALVSQCRPPDALHEYVNDTLVFAWHAHNETLKPYYVRMWERGGECILISMTFCLELFTFYVRRVVFCKKIIWVWDDFFWEVWNNSKHVLDFYYNDICASFYDCQWDANYAPASEKCWREAF